MIHTLEAAKPGLTEVESPDLVEHLISPVHASDDVEQVVADRRRVESSRLRELTAVAPHFFHLFGEKVEFE